jgi:hypothetical protein
LTLLGSSSLFVSLISFRIFEGRASNFDISTWQEKKVDSMLLHGKKAFVFFFVISDVSLQALLSTEENS